MTLNVVYSSGLIITSIIILYAAGYAYIKGVSSVRYTFALLCICSALYSFGYALELVSTNLDSMHRWGIVQYSGLSFIAGLWILISLQYTGRIKKVTIRVLLLVMLIPVMTFVFRYTTDATGFFYKSTAIDTSGVFPVLSIEYGPWYFVFSAYMFISVLFSAILFLRLASYVEGTSRAQIRIMVTASLIPLVAHIINIAGLAPYNLDMGPITMSIGAILFMLGLFRLHLLNIIPLSRDKFFECTGDAVVILDGYFKVADYNPVAERIFAPLLNRAAVGQEIQKVFLSMPDFLHSVLERSDSSFKDSRSCRYYSSRIFPLMVRQMEVGYAILINDVTIQVETMKQMELLANTDALTGLINRRYFMERAGYEIIRHQRYHHSMAMIMLDLDEFKRVNDTYGHLTGDDVLKEVAARCTRTARITDYVARFGGEEFIILLPETNMEEATELAERLRANIEKSVFGDEKAPIYVTVSLGVVSTELTECDCQPYEFISCLIDAADKALYNAKEDGRNRVITRKY